MTFFHSAKVGYVDKLPWFYVEITRFDMVFHIKSSFPHTELANIYVNRSVVKVLSVETSELYREGNVLLFYYLALVKVGYSPRYF